MNKSLQSFIFGVLTTVIIAALILLYLLAARPKIDTLPVSPLPEISTPQESPSTEEEISTQSVKKGKVLKDQSLEGI